MCTVSFYRNKDQVIITSNRDENINRPLAIPPKLEYVNGTKLFFPKDPQAGGSWFVINEFNQAFILLNGALFKHKPNPPYRLSRGIILLEIASAQDFEQKWISINLTNIEPFTCIVFANNKLYQLRWNGETREFTELNNSEPQIWSSATLYAPEIIENRKKWFMKFVQDKKQKISAEDLIYFHTNTQNNDSENGLIINRNQKMLTKNVTQFVLTDNRFKLTHYDLMQKTKSILE